MIVVRIVLDLSRAVMMLAIVLQLHQGRSALLLVLHQTLLQFHQVAIAGSGVNDQFIIIAATI